MQLTDEQVAEEVTWIERQAAWPAWPVLPMKNIHRSEPDYPDQGHALLLATGMEPVMSAGPRTIYFKNIWELVNGSLKEQLEDAEKKTYESTEAMVRDGWIGD